MIKSKKPTLLHWLAAGTVVAVLIFGFMGGCTKPREATRVLEQQGYTEIEITGWRPFAAGEDDTFATGFRAKSPNGDVVTGTVTGGILKGSTIRLD